MTFEERMAELGVDLSDLPNNKHAGMPYPVSRYESLLKQAADFTGFDAPAGFEIFNVLQYALHLVDVIDRMETRIVNLTGERDYLFERASGAGVLDCEDCLYNGEDCNDRCYDGTGLEHGVWVGVPEDWSADNE